ncbi:RF-1 domain-containing protein [Baffinella frigidus]|nr:RF-1 domain-containing protein [Cryptophyta sp. CCMP2293]
MAGVRALWGAAVVRQGISAMRKSTCAVPSAGPGLWFSVHAPKVVRCTGSPISRQLSAAAGPTGGEGLGVVELTNAGYEARRSIWGQISDAKIADLARRIAVLGIKPADISEEFIRGSGRGGQKMNKTASKVRITHHPSGVQVAVVHKEREQRNNRYLAMRALVAVQKERERSKNRFLAMRALVERLENPQGGGDIGERDRIRKAKAR